MGRRHESSGSDVVGATVGFGCTLVHGPRDWQVLQRDRAGGVTVRLAGTWSLPPDRGDGAEFDPERACVVVRVLDEDTGSAAGPGLDWHAATTRTDGTWGHELRLPAGGLYRLETAVRAGPVEWAARGDFVHHIGVGEVWAVAGQSNAAGYGRGPVEDPVELGVHALRNDGTWSVATHPLNDTRGNTGPNLETFNPGHSPFLAFGRELKRALGCPVGIVPAARGSSAMASWNPAVHPDAPLYRHLLHRIALAGGSIAGLVWHQGEGEAEKPELASGYLALLVELIAAVRADLDDETLPVVVAQVNRFLPDGRPRDPDVERSWSVVREAQRRVAHLVPHVAVVPTVDLALSDIIHTSPAANLVLGRRFAEAALGLVHGRAPLHRYPEIRRAVPAGPAEILLEFEHVTERLQIDGAPPAGFAAEDAAGDVPVTVARAVDASVIALSLARPTTGTAYVHGAFGRDPDFRVYDVAGHRPALAFHCVPVSPEERP